MSNEYQFLKIYVISCANTSDNEACASKEDQYQFFRKVIFIFKFQIDINFRFVNSFFDFNDFDIPVKSFIEDRVYFPIEPYTKKGADIFVKRAFT